MVSSTFTFLYHLMLYLLLNSANFINILLDSGCLPRYRWDQLLVLAWRAFLPVVLVGVFFVTVIFVSNLTFFHDPSDTSSLGMSFLILFKKISETKIFKYVLKIYCIYILYIRSFFVNENPNFIYIIAILILAINTIKHDFISLFGIAYIWITIGVNLITYDMIGSKISYYLQSAEGYWLYTYLCIKFKDSPNILKRHIGNQIFTAMILGNTKMTSTGRATLLTGVCTGAAWLVNSHFDRQAANRRCEAELAFRAEEGVKQRIFEAEKTAKQCAFEAEKTAKQCAFQAGEAAKQRAYNSFETAHTNWNKKYFNKEPEPKFEDYKDKFK